MRHTRSHTKNRRSHHALKDNAVTSDETGTKHLRHRASKDGRYRGRQVVDAVAKVEKRQSKKKDLEQNAR
jgi:ribosomal protein L32